MARRRYEELFHRTGRFTSGTRTRLERTVGRALLGYTVAQATLRSAVRSATHELRSDGLADVAILAILAAVVEDAGRACGADRTSLLSGQPVWMPVQARVVESAQRELAALVTHS